MVGCKEKKVNDYCAHSLYEYHWFETGTLQSVQKYKNGGCYGKKFVYYDSDTIERVTSYIIPIDMEFYSKTIEQGWHPNGTMEYRITTDSTKHCHGEGPIVEKKETWDEDGNFCGETYREYYM
jgi:antitoxin component YwqK of YwqJK toxin-antitoxin module